MWGSQGEIEGLGYSQLGGILCYGSEVVLREGEVGGGAHERLPPPAGTAQAAGWVGPREAHSWGARWQGTGGRLIRLARWAGVDHLAPTETERCLPVPGGARGRGLGLARSLAAVREGRAGDRSWQQSLWRVAARGGRCVSGAGGRRRGGIGLERGTVRGREAAVVDAKARFHLRT